MNEAIETITLPLTMTTRPALGMGYPEGTCCDCGAPLGYDKYRCDKHAEEIHQERLENGRWDERQDYLDD
jgi:predicted amidophosphoribosyltransferase